MLYSINEYYKTGDIAQAVSIFLTCMDSISSSLEQGIMEQAYNSSSQKIEADRPEVQDHA